MLLNSKCSERVCFKVVTEFKIQVEMWVIIFRALYRLKYYVAFSRDHLAHTLHDMIFLPTIAYHDVCMRSIFNYIGGYTKERSTGTDQGEWPIDSEHYYECILTWVN